MYFFLVSPKMRCGLRYAYKGACEDTFGRKNIQNSRKNMFAEPPAWPLADRAGRRLGSAIFIPLSINKVRLLKGVCQSSFALRNNPKLSKNHVRRPVSRRTVSQVRNISTF